MKVIDLAIGFSKGIIPPKIKYKGVVYTYDASLKEYLLVENNTIIKPLSINVEQFNNEVEIIEDTPKEDNKIEKLDIYFNGSENKISIEDATDTDTQIEFVAYRLNDMIDEFYKLKDKIDKVNGENNENIK